MDAHDRRRSVDVAHDERNGSFYPRCRSRNGFVAGLRIDDDALEAENAEMTPASREVGVGYFFYGGEGHSAIIRF